MRFLLPKFLLFPEPLGFPMKSLHKRAVFGDSSLDPFIPKRWVGHLTFGRGQLTIPKTWRIIPDSKLLITIVIVVAPKDRVVGPLPNGLFMAYKWSINHPKKVASRIARSDFFF